MLYVDTSVLVALCTNEAKTADVIKWYAACSDELICAAWCVTEFASALGIKQRTGQLTQAQAQAAWTQFERICANDLQLIPVQTQSFHRAAVMSMEASAGLRAGDALHLACAKEANAQAIVTLDTALAKNAKRFKIKPVSI
jgi:predicted nucleic acid-binding protein